MVVEFFCPSCWGSFPEDSPHCPHCGFDLRAGWDSKAYLEKLLLALHHPVRETAVRACWILGRLRAPEAVGPLAELAAHSEDPYLAAACAQALACIGTAEARAHLRALRHHPSCLVRAAIGGGERSGPRQGHQTG